MKKGEYVSEKATALFNAQSLATIHLRLLVRIIYNRPVADNRIVEIHPTSAKIQFYYIVHVPTLLAVRHLTRSPVLGDSHV